MADRTIQIIVDVNDRASGNIGGLVKQLAALERTADRLNKKFAAFANRKYEATLALIDRVSAPATRLNTLLRKMAERIYNISLRVNDNVLTKIKQIENSLIRMSSKAYNIALNVRGAAGQKLSGLLSGAALGAGVFAPMAGMAGIGFGIGNAVQSYAAFGKQMSKVYAIAQLDKDSAAARMLTEQAKDLGKNTAWTRKQVAEAQFYQALAGWSPERIQAATPHILNLASAADMDLGRASDFVTDAMTAFQIEPTAKYRTRSGAEVDTVQEFTDLIAKTQAVSNTTAEQMAGAMKYSANLFGAMSANLTGQAKVQKAMDTAREAFIMTGLLANAGIKESMAGTGMSNIIQRMTSGNRNAYYGLGLTGTQIEDVNHDILPFGQIIKQLNKAYHEGMDTNALADFVEEMTGEKIHADTRRKLNKLTRDIMENGGKMGTADMMQLSTMLGGAEHAHKLLALIMGDWDAMEAKLSDVHGTASDMANKMLDNLAGSFTKLGSAWDNFQQNLLEGGAGEGLRAFVDAVTELINRADTLFKDGISLKDLGSLFFDAVNRLKAKFLELEGLGSLLAGGALMGGLMKIIGWMKALREVATGVNGAARSLNAQKVGTMTVSAGVVNVNGRFGGGGKVGNTAIIDNYNRTKERLRGVTPVTNTLSNMKSAAGYGAAFAGIFGLMDVLAVKSMNAERLSQASPEERGVVMRENRLKEWETSTGALGSVAGAAIGAGLGSIAGPLGTTIGGIIGATIGNYLGVEVGKRGASMEEGRSVHSENLSAAIDKTLHPRPKIFFEQEPQIPSYEFKSFDLNQIKGRHIDKDFKPDAALSSESLIRESTLNELQHEKMVTLTDNFMKQYEAQLTALEYYQQQRAGWTPDMFQWQLPEWGTRAEAAELPSEQMMERGDIQPEIPLNEIDLSGLTESLYSELESLQEVVYEIILSIGDTFSEGLSVAFEGAGEIFSGLSEIIMTGMASAQETVASSLEGISQAFTSTKEQVQAVWSELPGFFSGVFSGLGGAAESAGAAIYAGLTSVIGAVIGAWEAAAATVRSIVASISAAASSFSLPSAGTIAAHAEGGLVTRPEVALIGEAGPELILPLSNPERSRELLSNTALTEGGSVNGISMNVSFNVTSSEPREVVSEVREHLTELGELIASELSRGINAVYNNQAMG